MKQLYFKTSDDWREWLRLNHDSENEVWLVFYKNGDGKPSITYEPAVEEALCYGWIDSILKRVDDAKYVRKFTPRKESSRWSPSNKARVARLIDNGRMTGFGLAKIEAAKRNGQWDAPDRPDIQFVVPDELQSALDENNTAMVNFEQLAPSYQKQYITWITVAKRPETRDKRVNEAISLLEKGQKLGIK